MDSKNWIKRVVYFQEKKVYSMYIILIFALFVGITRSLEEVMLAHRIYSEVHVLNNCVFYFLMIWSYTFVLSLFAKEKWQKVINVVLIGVFLGIFPPVIDVFIYGIGNFKYTYHVGVPTLKVLTLFDTAHGSPIGEGLVLWATIVFSGYYIYLKTSSISKSLLGGALVYTLILMISGAIIPSMAAAISRKLSMPSMVVISILQLTVAIVFFFLLNCQVSRALALRSLHCIPFVLLVFLGAAISGGIKSLTFAMAFMVFYAGLTSLVQNDFFDKKEDALSGRQGFVDRQDVHFFNSTYLGFIFLLYNMGSLIFLPLIILFICSILYNYDFYRGKRFFPANYKIEGIWGFSSFLTGILCQKSPVFTPEILIYSFLVFGGWSLVATFKDYKDIEVDKAVWAIKPAISCS